LPELLVGLALGMILIGIVVFVWLQAGEIFNTTVSKIEAHVRLRIALDAFERDASNMDRTTEMDFFDDADGDGHKDPGEGRVTVGGQDLWRPAHPDLGDPLWSGGTTPLDEFDGDPGAGGQLSMIAGFSGAATYVFAPVILSPQPVTYERLAFTDGQAFFRDQAYFRSHAPVDGSNRTSLVHYRLVQQAAGRPAQLRRRVWYRDANGDVVRPNPASGAPGTDRFGLLVDGLLELKVGFFLRESPAGDAGQWYHAAQPSGGYGDDAHRALVEGDESRFIPARGTGAKGYADAISPQHANQGQFGGRNAVAFVYRGCGRLELDDEGQVVLRPLAAAPDADLTSIASGGGYDAGMTFPGAGPGSIVCLSEPTDDDGTSAPNGYRTAADYVANSRPDPFPQKHFVVDRRRDSDGAIVLREGVAMDWLERNWLGSGDTSFNVRYRVGFIPGALSVRVACEDPRNKRILRVERVVRLVR
jgi:hypothetical protein